MSERASTGCPCACSGERYDAVPSTVAVAVTVSADAARAMPKSMTFTSPERVTMMLPGLMSRWTMPALCASASAEHTAPASSTARSGSRRPPCERKSARVLPSTYSMTM
jgi:hypothetical protein